MKNKIELQRAKARWKMLLVLLVCAAPVIAALLAYYVWPPQGAGTNYGALIQPQRPLPTTPPLTLTHLDGKPFNLQALHGHWLMVYVGAGACDQQCEEMLFALRQIRLMTGKNMDRLERVWLITDQTPLSTTLIRAHDGLWMLRANSAELKNYFPLELSNESLTELSNTVPLNKSLPATTMELRDHLWLIDPLGNLMMRFPKNADPQKIYKDVAKLLYTSNGWVMKKNAPDASTQSQPTQSQPFDGKN